MSVIAPDRQEREAGGRPALLFRVAGESFAAPLGDVEEAVDVGALHDLPGANGALRGVVLVRERLLPAYVPAAALGVMPLAGGTALVIRRGDVRVAVLVDDVDDVITVREGELQAAPSGGAAMGVVRGVVRHASQLVALVDVDAMVAALRGADRSEDA